MPRRQYRSNKKRTFRSEVDGLTGSFVFRFSALEQHLPESVLAVRAMLAFNDLNAAYWANMRTGETRSLEYDVQQSIQQWTVRMGILHLREAMHLFEEIKRQSYFDEFITDSKGKALYDRIAQYSSGGLKKRVFTDRVLNVRNWLVGHYDPDRVSIAISSRASKPHADVTSMQGSTKTFHTHFRAADDIQATIIFRLAWLIPDSVKDATTVYNSEIDTLFDLMGDMMNFLYCYSGWFVLKRGIAGG